MHNFGGTEKSQNTFKTLTHAHRWVKHSDVKKHEQVLKKCNRYRTRIGDPKVRELILERFGQKLYETRPKLPLTSSDQSPDKAFPSSSYITRDLTALGSGMKNWNSIHIMGDLQNPIIYTLPFFWPYFCGEIPWTIALRNRPEIYGRHLQSMGSCCMAIDLCT